MVSYYSYDAAYRPNLANVKKYGVAINGYLTGIYQNTTTQPSEAHAAGLGYQPTYELGPSEFVGASVAKGRVIGQNILDAFERVRIPMDGSCAVYPSVDVNVASSKATSCNNGWEGVLSKIDGKISLRAYAEGAIITALGNAGLVQGKCWLAAPTSWPVFDVNNPYVGMIQLVGSNVGGTDQNHIIVDPAELGFWWPSGSPFAKGGLHMDADVKAAFAALNAHLNALDAAVAAVARNVWRQDVIPIDPTNKDNPNWYPTSVLVDLRKHVVDADNQSASAASGISALKTQVGFAMTNLQTQINALSETIKAQPQASVDLSGKSFPATITVDPS